MINKANLFSGIFNSVLSAISLGATIYVIVCDKKAQKADGFKPKFGIAYKPVLETHNQFLANRIVIDGYKGLGLGVTIGTALNAIKAFRKIK